jgi:hypothetical protein
MLLFVVVICDCFFDEWSRMDPTNERMFVSIRGYFLLKRTLMVEARASTHFQQFLSSSFRPQPTTIKANTTSANDQQRIFYHFAAAFTLEKSTYFELSSVILSYKSFSPPVRNRHAIIHYSCNIQKRNFCCFV